MSAIGGKADIENRTDTAPSRQKLQFWWLDRPMPVNVCFRE